MGIVWRPGTAEFAMAWGLRKKTWSKRGLDAVDAVAAAGYAVDRLGMRRENALFPVRHRLYRHRAKSLSSRVLFRIDRKMG
jgi:hypothetical protein